MLFVRRWTAIAAIFAVTGLASETGRAATFEAADTEELINAMEQAEADPGPDIITLAAQHTYTLDSEYIEGLALPTVTDELRIEGNGATLAWSGETETGFLHVAAEGSLVITRLTLTGARAGAIVVDGELDLQRSRLTENQMFSDRLRGVALTINEGGRATVRRSVFRENAFGAWSNSSVCSPERQVAGGIFNAGRLRVKGSTFIGNHASCVFALNFAGRIHYRIGALINTGTAVIVNATLFGNSGDSVINQGKMRFINGTVIGDDLVNDGNGEFSIVNSAIIDAPCTALDSRGGNVSTTNRCALGHLTDRQVHTLRAFGFFQVHTLRAIDLDRALDASGVVPVLPLRAGSPLLDTADPAWCPERDALGRKRPVDGDHDGRARCDVGAVELHPGPYPVDGRVTGLWLEPDRDGHYLLLEQPEPERLTLFWATFDGAGNPLWLYGGGRLEGNRLTVDLHLQTGMRFGSFRRSDLSVEKWGEMTLEIANCRELAMNWRADGRPALDGEAVLTRLTQVQGQECLP